jgi:hypothetical protein
MRWLLVGPLVACRAEPTPQELFAEQVVPVFEASCASSTCHGVAPGAEASGEVIAWDTFVLQLDEQGRLADLPAARAASLRAINTVEPPFSSLLRKPSDRAWGGLSHRGLSSFTSPEDPAYQALLAWIEAEPQGGEDPEPLSALEQQFADEVQPELVALSCFNASCHGLSSAVPFRLDAGIGGQHSIEGTRHNLEAARSMVSLDGYPLQSRLLRKALPLHDGGLGHKGGNAAFLQGLDDERVQPIVDWICAERLEATGLDCVQEPSEDPLRSFVYVRGELPAEGAFQLDSYAPGTDIWLATLVDGRLETENLTASLHDGGGDARDPALDAEGRMLAFSLRQDEDSGHELWELDLQTREARQLTTSAGKLAGGGLATDRDPAWGPEGTLWFVSTRLGLVADAGQQLDAELFELDLHTRELVRRSWTPHIERYPAYLVLGEEAGGEISFTALRDALEPQSRAHPFRFPTGLRTEYHQHFGITPPEDLLFDLRELADGRYVAVLGDLGSAWAGGRLVVIDRNLGPELNGRAETLDPGLPFYLEPMTRLDPDSSASGTTGRLWRDPVGLPDGSLLAALAKGPLDLDDPLAEPHLSLARLELVEGSEGPELSWEPLLEDAEADLWDPQPVLARHLPPSDETWSWDEGADQGRIHHQGVATIDALLGNLYPSGLKEPRADFAWVRLVEHLPLTPNERSGASLGSHGPARILAELPLAADGTFQAVLPAELAFRIQLLDERRLAVGEPHNRWFDVHPGQTIPQGVQVEHYDTLCAACHGALDGDPEQVFVEPDGLSGASLTLSRYQDQDARRPIEAPELGEATRIELDFERDVQPLLIERCGACHADQAPVLSAEDDPQQPGFSLAYSSLLEPGSSSANGMAWVDEPEASSWTSHLVEVLLGEELGAPGELSSLQPHPVEDPLSEEELLLITRWIDLGATWRGGP